MKISPERCLLIGKRVARDLFTNGAGQRALRLVLELDGGRAVGVWRERSVAVQIAAHLADVLEADDDPQLAIFESEGDE